MKLGFIEVAFSKKAENEFFKEMSRNVKNMHLVTGRYDVLMEVTFKNMNDLLSLLHKIQRFEYVIRSRMIMSLDVIKDELKHVRSLRTEEQSAIYENKIIALLGIYARKTAKKTWISELKPIKHVKRIFTTQGPYDGFCTVVGKNMHDIWQTSNAIRGLSSIKNTETYFVLRSVREDLY